MWCLYLDCLYLQGCDFSPFFVLFSVDNALMRSCVKNAPQAPINVNLSSSQQQAAFSKGLREHSSPYFSSPRSFF